uniref:glycosyltransferase n=1 Tax=Lentilactobacillus hilgardii TaxID=1588 RepID=UPI00403EFB91
MYYFLDNRLDPKSSGIEHAEIKRLRLFHQLGEKAQLVMCDFNRFAHDNLRLYGLTDDDYINMFDYFAGTVHYPARDLTISHLSIDQTSHISQRTHGYEVSEGNRKTLFINLMPNSEQINTVKYFNGDGNCTKQDFYDTRGFKSLTQFYATNKQELVYEQFYKPNGAIYYEISYEQRPNWLAATNIQLINFTGKNYSLMNIGEAFTIMLDHLNQNDGDKLSTFISDRSNITNLPMINMKTPARKIEHFHNIHFRDYWDPMNSPLTYPSVADTDLLRQTDLVIVPTPQQAADMKERLKTQVPIVAIPVGIVPDQQLNAPRITFQKRQPGKIIAVARLFYEKRLDDAIKAFAKAHKRIPNLTLDIYGYGDGNDNYKEEKMLKALTQELQLTDFVHFKGYQTDMRAVYNSAQLMIMSSRYEGAPLSIIEAQSHGVPVISYNTHYGPAYLIRNGVSGNIVPDGNVNALADSIITYFRDPRLQVAMSKNADENAARFSSDQVWQSWQKYVINGADLF